MADKQMALFNTQPKTQTKPETKDDQSKQLTPADIAYQKIEKHHLVHKCSLYSSQGVKDIFAWYITNGSLYGETAEKLCKRIKALKPGYYHLKPGFKCLRYDAWLLSQVDKSLAQK